MAASGGCTRALLLPLLAAFSALLTGLYVADVVSVKSYVSSCEMTYSWPVYTPVGWSAARHHKYELFHVDMKQHRAALTGVPVLFLPGHMGSYKQARSLARHLWDSDPELFDVFAADFQEEPTGLNGNFLTEQATYVNDAVRAILRQYKKQSKSSKSRVKVPHSVVIVAHSMGGAVARTAELLPNYKRRSIQHVIALGVPYEAPSYPFDAEAHAVYDRMHAKPDASDVVYVSIAGGHNDMLVHASLSLTESVAPHTHALAALASAIPGVETPVDHFCLLWCHQLLEAVAKTLHAAVDPETRELVSDPQLRLSLAQQVLIDGGDVEHDDADVAGVSNVSLHRVYLREGYRTDEFAAYALLLPQFLFHLLRTQLSTLVVIMYALALHILCAQVAQWQGRFSFTTSTPQDAANQDNFPSFTSMLHPVAHTPVSVKSGVAYVSETLHNGRVFGLSATTVATTTGGLVVAGLALFLGLDKDGGGVTVAQLPLRWQAQALPLAELAVMYGYALGLLYLFATLLSALRRFVVSPIVSLLTGVTHRLKLRRWMLVALIYALVLGVGHMESVVQPLATRSVDPSRVLALLVLATFVVFVVYLLALGGSTEGSMDQQRMQRSLFAVLLLSIFPWVGKAAYFTLVVKLPPPELSTEVTVEGASYIVLLALTTYLATLSLDEMVPLPPTAFFGVSSGQDAASIYGNSASQAKSGVKITAENCPKCVFQDGGPGAVLVEYTDRNTRRILAGKTREVVYVGPTFRVVSCDCVYRFAQSRAFCDFCVRSCRLCGGGNGNFHEAAKYKDFLEESKLQLAMHALVPVVLQLCAAVQVTYGLHRAHLSFYLTPVCVLALVVYHLALCHPIEARRIRNRRRNKSKKKSKKSKKAPTKSSNTSKSSGPSSTASSSTSTSATAPSSATASKKKKKRKAASTSSTS